MEFWRYYRIIRRRRWLIILGILVCVGAVAMKNYTTQPLYTGRTTLMESKGMSREGIELYRESYLQLDLQLRLSNLSNIATSQTVLERSAETLSELGLSFSPEEILRKTTVEPVRDTNILAIEVTLPEPRDAKVAADVMASELKKSYSELNNAALVQSREFIQAQLDTTKKALEEARDRLKDYKKNNEIVQLDQQAVATIQRMSQAKVEMNSAHVSYQTSAARVAELESELANMTEWHTAGTTTARNPVWQKLKTQLVDLETAKASMTSGAPGQPRRGPNHLDVINVQRQIDDVKAQMGNAKEEYIASTSEAKNPNYMNAVDRWIVSKVEEIAASAREEALGRVINDMRGEFADLPEKEAELAQREIDVEAATQTYGLMRTKLDEARIREEQAKNETALKTIDYAYVYPVNQRQALKLMLALLLSPVLGVGVAFLLHYTDNTVRTASDAEKVLGMPVVSVVPAARAHSLPRQKCAEVTQVAYQMLTSTLWIANQKHGVNSVVVASAEPDVGRSVAASNLAVSLAGEGARVILVDADLRQPTQHLIFGVANKVGLTNVLSGAATLEDALEPTKIQGLLLVPSGPVSDNPIKLLRSAELKSLIDQVSEFADFVIYDTPTGVAFPDAVLVASQVGSAVIVHSAGRVPRGSEIDFSNKMESVGVRLLGALLNKVRREDSSGYFHYRRSYEGIGIAQLPGGKKSLDGGDTGGEA